MRKFLLLGALTFLASVAALSAQQPPAAPATAVVGRSAERVVPAPATPARAVAPRLLPGTRESAFSTIQGNAGDGAGHSMANSVVRLRDARLGRIVDTLTTDKSGAFAFKGVDPGNYVVELMSPSSTVLTASPMLSVNAGEVVSAALRLPFVPPFAGLFGQNAAQATVLTSAAASTGVLNVAATVDVSPDGTPVQ